MLRSPMSCCHSTWAKQSALSRFSFRTLFVLDFTTSHCLASSKVWQIISGTKVNCSRWIRHWPKEISFKIIKPRCAASERAACSPLITCAAKEILTTWEMRPLRLRPVRCWDKPSATVLCIYCPLDGSIKTKLPSRECTSSWCCLPWMCGRELYLRRKHPKWKSPPVTA